MKKSRKGFTLVELLIVIAILGALSAAMATSVTGATAKAKAATIASNVNTCISAARLYAINKAGDDLAETTADNVMYESLPTWKDFSTATIKYENVTDGKGIDGWAIQVDFSGDSESDAIAGELLKIPGFKKSYSSASDASGTEIIKQAVAASGSGENAVAAQDGVYTFKVKLTSGQIVAAD